MADQDRTRSWRRPERAGTVSDAIQLLRRAIAQVRNAPDDDDARRRLRAIAAEHALWEQLGLLLADEARAQSSRPAVAAVFLDELAEVHDLLDQPLEAIATMEQLIAIAPDEVAHHERLAALYRQVGAWSQAADSYEQVGLRAQGRRADAATTAAAQLNREHGRLERAEALYRRIVERHPTDLGAWRALDDVLSELEWWDDVADVRGERAALAPSGFEKAALLRAQARALEQAGELGAAAQAVASASKHAPDQVSGLVDHADVLARSGQGGEAAAILRARIAEGGAPDDVAALRLRLAQVLDEACDDRAGAIAVLRELLGDRPDHVAALETITAFAATDPDPRAHADALLRYAAVVPEGERASYLAAAGRRLRDAGEPRAAAEALERAIALANDPEARRELAELRGAEVVAAAAAAAGAGDREGAERRLRAILAADPAHVAANLALADLIPAAAAAEQLRDALAAAGDDAPARLVFRLAQAIAATGDVDESHTLLHEAHRLDRGSIEVTIALGESCFARRLWRQAALHLAAAAEHPDAARHATAVAAGLVHAAQAEVRALRPGNAGKHHETAVRIDPRCAPAWHGLAELASERGDLSRAAECLEREAEATTDPAARIRLFDALGDMMLDVLGDPARAEKMWLRIDADQLPVLTKLLALQRRRGATLERAETCARLAPLAAEPAGRKALWIEAIEALAAGGALAQASAAAEELLGRFPRDPDAVVHAVTTALAAGDPRKAAGWARQLVRSEDPSAGLELARAIGAPLADPVVPPSRAIAADEAYAAALDDDDRKELIDDPDDGALRDVLALLAEALPLVAPNAVAALAKVPDAQRVAAGSGAAAAMLPQVSRALGGPPTLLYASPEVDDATVLFASPPIVLLAPALASIPTAEGDAALRFQLGRVVELSRPHRIFAAMPDDAFAELVADLANDGERLRARLPVALRRRLSERTRGPLDRHAYLAACRRAADRAGLIACGDAAVAIALAGGPREAAHLVRLAASPRYLGVRKKLRALAAIQSRR